MFKREKKMWNRSFRPMGPRNFDFMWKPWRLKQNPEHWMPLLPMRMKCLTAEELLWAKLQLRRDRTPGWEWGVGVELGEARTLLALHSSFIGVFLVPPAQGGSHIQPSRLHSQCSGVQSHLPSPSNCQSYVVVSSLKVLEGWGKGGLWKRKDKLKGLLLADSVHIVKGA